MLLRRFFREAFAPCDSEHAFVYANVDSSKLTDLAYQRHLKALTSARGPGRRRRRGRRSTRAGAAGALAAGHEGSWAHLHPLLLTRIAQCCSPAELLTMRLVNRHWQRVVDEDVLGDAVLFHKDGCSNPSIGAAVFGLLGNDGERDPRRAYARLLASVKSFVVLESAVHRFETHFWLMTRLLTQLRSLEHIALHQSRSCMHVDMVHHGMSALTSLRSLELVGFNRPGHIYEPGLRVICRNLTNLEELRVRGVYIQRTGQTDLQHLQKLTMLVLLDVRVSAVQRTRLQGLSELQALQHLVIPAFPIWNPAMVGDIAGLTGLTRLDVSRDTRTDVDLAPFSSLKDLRALSIRNHKLRQQPDAFWDAGYVTTYGFLASLTRLTQLDASETSVSQLQPFCFGGLTRLRQLTLRAPELRPATLHGILAACPLLVRVDTWSSRHHGVLLKLPLYVCLQLRQTAIRRAEKQAAHAVRTEAVARPDAEHASVTVPLLPQQLPEGSDSADVVDDPRDAAEGVPRLSEQQLEVIGSSSGALAGFRRGCYQFGRFGLQRPLEAMLLYPLGFFLVIVDIIEALLILSTFFLGSCGCVRCARLIFRLIDW